MICVGLFFGTAVVADRLQFQRDRALARIGYHAAMRILLTNDDGIDAPGLRALYLAVKDLGDVHVIAPTQVQSAMSHAVTFHRPIRVVDHDDGVVRGLSVDGRPADCVKLALAGLVDGPIDLVLSGMNSGANVGINVIYSGTVAAAVEGSFHSIPSIACSLYIGDWDHDNWGRAAAHARQTIDRVLADGIAPGTAVNINVPKLDGGFEPLGVRSAPVSMAPTNCRYGQTADKDGRLYQINNSLEFQRIEPGTDVAELFAGYITVTPLRFDVTARDGASPHTS